MRDILVLCPQERDLVAIRAAGLEDRYRVRYEGSDLDQLEDFDPEPFLGGRRDASGRRRHRHEGPLGAPGLDRRRAPGAAGPERRSRILALQHKPTSRDVQRLVAPRVDAEVLPPRRRDRPATRRSSPSPSSGRLSQNAYRIDDLSELSKLHEADRYTNRYAEIAAIAGGDPRERCTGFIGEELLSGDEVTLEGYVHGG